MEVHSIAIEWGETFRTAMTELWTKVAVFIPNLIGTILILVVGILVSKLLQKIAKGMLTKLGFDKASNRIGLATVLERAKVKSSASEIVARIVFWLFMLTFLISASETLGLKNVSQTIDSFVNYLPNVIGASLIGVIGLLLGHFVKDLIRSGAEGVGVEYSRGLSNLAYGVIIVLIGSLAIGQLQIQTELINRTLEIILLACGFALALSLGLGTRDIAKNIVAGVYTREQYEPGTSVTVDNEQGVVQEVGAVSTKLMTKKGKSVYIPNFDLINTVVFKESND